MTETPTADFDRRGEPMATRVITRLTPRQQARLSAAITKENRRRAIAGDDLLATPSAVIRAAIDRWCEMIESYPAP